MTNRWKYSGYMRFSNKDPIDLSKLFAHRIRIVRIVRISLDLMNASDFYDPHFRQRICEEFDLDNNLIIDLLLNKHINSIDPILRLWICFGMRFSPGSAVDTTLWDSGFVTYLLTYFESPSVMTYWQLMYARHISKSYALYGTTNWSTEISRRYW